MEREEESKEERRNVDSSFDYCHEDSQEIIPKDYNKLASTKAEMDEARDENRRLKFYLSKIMKDYETLQTQYNQMVQQQPKISPKGHQEEEEEEEEEEGEKEEEIDKGSEELVSLSLGRRKSPVSSGSTTIEEKKKALLMVEENVEEDGEGLSIGLDYQVVNPNEKEDTHQKETFEINNNNNNQSPDSFGLRNYGDDHDEDLLQPNLVKRARVSVRARCDTPTMNDGCQWRKYGQKIAKGNPCPRAYYRCTVAPSCPVRKQVQRCPEDMSILVTTYEGTHNHPLSNSATAMASATAAAASMLLSGNASTVTNLQGLNFYLSGNSSKPRISSYLSTSNSSSTTPSSSSSSSSLPHPTITLDLTTSTSSPSQPFFSLLNRFSSSSSGITNSFLQAPRSYSSTNLNFSSSNMNSPLGSTNTLYWGSHGAVRTTYGTTFSGSTSTHQVPYHLINNQTESGALDPFGRSLSQPIQGHVNFASIKNMLFSSSNPTSLNQASLPAETIEAITSNPSFQSALANVLSSIIGGDGNIDLTKTQGEKNP